MDITTLLIAVISLVVAGWTAWKAGLYQRHDLFLARRLELHSLMQEADALLLENPQLLRGFRTSETYTDVATWQPLERDSLTQFILIYLNVFEAAHSVFSETARLDTHEAEVRQAWERTIVKFFEDCPAAGAAWKEFRNVYYTEFQEFIDGLIFSVGALSTDPGAVAESFRKSTRAAV